jgi:hypothetical protein
MYFVADIYASTKFTGGNDAMLADDLNVFQEFDRLVSLPIAVSTLEVCRKRVHAREGRIESFSTRVKSIWS